jgi:hypothetical protein
MVLQTILLDRKRYSLDSAKKWIKKHGYALQYRNVKPEITKNFYRFRQYDLPKKKVAYYVKKIKEGILFVFYN